MVGNCLTCGAPLPRNSRSTKKYCDDACRNKWHRRRKNPLIQQRSKVNPSNGTGDNELDNIIFMEIPPTLRNTLLKDLLDKRKEEGKREALMETEETKHDRILSPEDAKIAARAIARKRYA